MHMYGSKNHMYIKHIWSSTYTHVLTQVMYQKKDTVENAEYTNVQLYIYLHTVNILCAPTFSALDYR